MKEGRLDQILFYIRVYHKLNINNKQHQSEIFEFLKANYHYLNFDQVYIMISVFYTFQLESVETLKVLKDQLFTVILGQEQFSFKNNQQIENQNNQDKLQQQYQYGESKFQQFNQEENLNIDENLDKIDLLYYPQPLNNYLEKEENQKQNFILNKNRYSEIINQNLTHKQFLQIPFLLQAFCSNVNPQMNILIKQEEQFITLFSILIHNLQKLNIQQMATLLNISMFQNIQADFINDIIKQMYYCSLKKSMEQEFLNPVVLGIISRTFAFYDLDQIYVEQILLKHLQKLDVKKYSQTQLSQICIGLFYLIDQQSVFQEQIIELYNGYYNQFKIYCLKKYNQRNNRYPNLTMYSFDILLFLESLNIEYICEGIIGPYNIDIFIPEYQQQFKNKIQYKNLDLSQIKQNYEIKLQQVIDYKSNHGVHREHLEYQYQYKKNDKDNCYPFIIKNNIENGLCIEIQGQVHYINQEIEKGSNYLKQKILEDKKVKFKKLDYKQLKQFINERGKEDQLLQNQISQMLEILGN
ncbi:hypothetical protein PPERSA_01181 [Pseudocohnilembus persalinus]|uniref:Uncharacterized protein n=1 Tax=Pseudocohnilembus persalinus TaxID=266149 RepID=A0A0V0R1A4_PSEPJ|nr:hypothetical protein PPERSA_01181 [Pseudocohnilembus persalinus]|eukprot:KRX08251.1 hypothetical protein PPERSA_01181 [Pseudocohnilembus persalinus]